MALENSKTSFSFFGYLLENHVWKSDDFSLNFVEFLLLSISKKIDFSVFKIDALVLFWLWLFGKREVDVWM